MQTQESNRMIDNYMGETWQSYPLLQHLNNRPYQSSWDYLMPVVEKISLHTYEDGEPAYPRTFGMPFTDGLIDSKPSIMVRFNRQQVFHGETLIEATYAAVIAFLHYYNTLKNENGK